MEKLAFIRAAFNSNKSTLAALLMKTRPTIYAWEAGGEIRAAADQLRLDNMFWVATEWNNHCRWPLGEYIDDARLAGKSLLDLLSTEILDRAEITRAIQLIAPKVTETLESNEKADAVEWATPPGSTAELDSNAYSPAWE